MVRLGIYKMLDMFPTLEEILHQNLYWLIQDDVLVTSNGIREVFRNGSVLMRVVNKGDIYYVQLKSEINVANKNSDSLTDTMK